MEFRVLGPVGMWMDGRAVDLGPTKSRLLLAILLIEFERTISSSTLVERAWPEAVPLNAAGSLQSSLSRLRQGLSASGDDRVKLTHTPTSGYRLTVPAETVDELEYRRIDGLGVAAARRGELKLAIDLLITAEKLVRGEPLSGLPGSWAENTRVRLQERHRNTTVMRIGFQLETEDPSTLIAELSDLAGQHPFDESVAGLLMRALHSAGRTADALKEYTAIDHRLREEYGVGPQPPLREIHRRILGGREPPSVATRRTPMPGSPTGSAGPGRTSGPPGPPTRWFDAPPGSASPPAPASAVADRPEAPNTLERDPPGFVGRKDDLDVLIHQITAQLDAGQTAIAIVEGMPGVGKSTLALRLAHHLRPHCPDGALHLNLRGHDLSQPPTSPENALGLLLGMMQTDAEKIQSASGLDHAIALWRRRTGNRRVLLLLDDPASTEQLVPLIPSGSRSIMLITARTRLIDLPEAIHHALPPMPRQDASTLFTQSARLSPIGNPADEAAVNAVITACDHLPLALVISGASLRTRPSWSIEDLVEDLAQTQSSAEPDLLNTKVTAAFDTSYRILPDLPKRMFRRLALYPGTRISRHAAAALAEAPVIDAGLALKTLVDLYLIEEPLRHQYRMHYLVRRFAIHALNREDTAEEQHATESRLLQFTVAAVDRATERFHPYRHVNLASHLAIPPSLRLLDFADPQQAAAWLDTEQTSLRALIEYWHSHGHPWEAAALAHMLAMYLDRRSLWKEGIRLHKNALDTWSHYDHTAGHATALTDLATAQWRLRAFEEAREYGEAALSLWTALGDTSGQADALLQLGRVDHFAHRHSEAIERFQQCAALYEANSEGHGQAVALYHLGAAHYNAGRLQEGIACTERALKLAKSTGDHGVIRNSTNNLGEGFRQLGDFSRADACYRQALMLAEQLGDGRNIATAALNVGELQTLQSQADRALAFFDRAVEIYRQLGDQHGQMITMLAQARARLQLQELHLAHELLDKATVIANSLGDPAQSAKAQLATGDIQLAEHNFHDAEQSFRSALALARQAGAPHLQAAAHEGIGTAVAALHGAAAARVHWSHALALFEPAYQYQAAALRARLAEAEAG